MNTGSGLKEAVRKAGGVSALAHALGVNQLDLSAWEAIPAEHVLEVEALTGVVRSSLRPDLYPRSDDPAGVDDEVDLARSYEYAMLGALLLRAPDAEALARLARLQGDHTPLGSAHAALARAAEAASAEAVRREYFDLFEGVGRGELLPYASYYLTGFLHEKPLARLRGDIGQLGVERAEDFCEPEDHLGTLCEIMSGFAGGRFPVSHEEQADFFGRHFAPWARRFFADLEKAKSAKFYREVGTVGRIFLEIEAEGFAMAARSSG